MAFRRYMCTTNIDYAYSMVGMGTLSGTSSGLEQGADGFTSRNSVGSEDETLSCGLSEKIG